MAGDSHKKTFLILTVFISIIAVGLTVAAFSTDNWVTFTGSKSNNTGCDKNISDDACTTYGSFGLFRGDNGINYYFGMRLRISQVICTDGWCTYYTVRTEETLDTEAGKDYIKNISSIYTETKDSGENVHEWEYGLFGFGYWVSILVMLSLGIVWGLVTISFTVFNIFGKPIETITGPLGLYLWNLLGLIFMSIGVILFAVLFQTNFAENVLPQNDYKYHTFRTESSLDYSFYFTVGSLVGFLLNLVLLMFSGYSVRCACTQEANKAIDNGIILY
ncbi:CLRN [Mytilus coruscus]|uniref:CLRN n=1 Tax=Mytilus coruscus TaxID=42192 RepID=A0A6J8EZG6_MYTCO|nr:CLRN [Mytilus coruscus]